MPAAIGHLCGVASMVRISTAGGVRNIEVEIALSERQQARGLMFRRSLAPGRGMLFPHVVAADLTMWMRHTYIPLDIVFIRADGRIHRIEADAEPLSERLIAAGAPVRAVLEISGGEAARLGIAPEDLVRHAVLGTGGADSDGMAAGSNSSGPMCLLDGGARRRQ